MTTPTSSIPSPSGDTASVIVWPDDGKEMIFVPGGMFTMGGNDGGFNHQPEHRVHVADFYLDRWPVTNAEYKRFADATGHPVPHYAVSWCDTEGYNWDPTTRMYPPDKADHPVVLVTWEDAMAYATWMRKRLPTEAEWERAARGMDGRRYPWGHEYVAGRCNCKETGWGGTSPVGYFSPEGDTPEGLVDMVGNVWEWTSSLFAAYPYDSSDGRESRQAPGFRVLRGASWVNDTTVAHCLSRLDGDFRFYNNVGFRCAASPE
jgi:formylglycine-generating enzyme required for sulfatase activity